MTTTEKLTQEQLAALPDAELNALAATLVMGWKKRDGVYSQRVMRGIFPRCAIEDWQPSIDRNQSGELLAKMAKRGVRFNICFWDGAEEIIGAVPMILLNRRDVFSVPGNSPRSETIAAILAAQALQAGMRNEARLMPDNKLSIRRCELVTCKGGIDGCNGSSCKNARWDRMTPQEYSLAVAETVYDLQDSNSRARACQWLLDDDTDSYNTGCGQKFLLNEGTPAENNFRFCPFCGKEIADCIDAEGAGAAQPRRWSRSGKRGEEWQKK